MIGGRLLVLAATVVCIAASPAAAFKKCRTADGKLMFVDVPPPGCVVEEEFENRASPAAEDESEDPAADSSPEDAATNAADASAIATRRRIERELASAADDLVRLDRELAGAPRMVPGVYVNLEDGSGSVRDGTEVRPDVAADIAARRQAVEDRIRGLRDDDAALTRDLADRHGGVPSWWSESPRCDRCP